MQPSAPEQRQPLIEILCYVALIPFLMTCLGAWTQGGAEMKLVQGVFVFYSAIILSFMGGSLWGVTITRLSSLDNAKQLILLSTGLALSGWFALLLPPTVAVGILLIGHILTLVYERRLELFEHLPHWYHKLRAKLTALVIGFHLIFAAALLF